MDNKQIIYDSHKTISKVSKEMALSFFNPRSDSEKRIILKSRHEVELAIEAGVTIYSEEIEFTNLSKRKILFILIPFDKIIKAANKF